MPEIPDCPDGAAALKSDLELEERRLQRYRDRVAEANELGLPDVAEALRPLLTPTQDHVIGRVVYGPTITRGAVPASPAGAGGLGGRVLVPGLPTRPAAHHPSGRR